MSVCNDMAIGVSQLFTLALTSKRGLLRSIEVCDAVTVLVSDGGCAVHLLIICLIQ